MFLDDTSAIIALAPALRFNGGGHINHSIFWETLSPNCGSPSEELSSAIKVSQVDFIVFIFTVNQQRKINHLFH